MALSKVFDTLKHSLLIAKLEAYVLERESLSYIKSYLSDMQQWARVNNNFSIWRKDNYRNNTRFNTWTTFI